MDAWVYEFSILVKGRGVSKLKLLDKWFEPLVRYDNFYRVSSLIANLIFVDYVEACVHAQITLHSIEHIIKK